MDARVDVRLLGPLRLQVDGAPVAVTAPRLRDRLCAWYLHASRDARRLRDDRGSILELDLLPAGVEPVGLSTPADALAWYDAERRFMAALIRLAHATGRDRATYQLVETCEGDLSGRDLGLHEELLLLALDSCKRLGEPVFEGFIHNSLGLRYVDQGDDSERATEHFRLAIARFVAAGHEIAESRALGNLGIAYARLGRHAEAVGQAIRYFREHCIRRGEGPALDTLGAIERARGRYDEALSCHLESLRLHGELGYPWGEAVVLTNLGKTYHAAGKPAEALDAWRRALVICDQIQAPRSDDLDREELVALIDAVGRG